jgi:hypothetical protein
LFEGISKEEARRKYGIRGKSAVLIWCRKFGYLEPEFLKPQYSDKEMTPEERKQLAELKERNKALEKALEESQLRAEAYSTMIDIAERELKISIRKKHDTKQSKK